MMKHKAMTGTATLKADGEAGTAMVAFAQLNVIDHDRDVTVPGAFQPGQKVKLCQTGHAHYALPIGAGEIVGEQDIAGSLWAVAEVKFFLDTPEGAATYNVVKALDELGHTQEWSYGYDILDAEQTVVDGTSVQELKSLSVYEISPVLRGAGIGTHTLTIKSQDDTACTECGQALPKAQDDTADTCATCEQPIADCTCDTTSDAKRRTVDALVRFEVDRARMLGAPIESE